jgi:alpha-ketoglutarate-dependent 2,4-dichlorophenoxyacetate dioxygenase
MPVASVLSFEQLRPTFAAEASGIDLREPLTPALRDELVAAMDRFAVLVFRKQYLTDEAHIAFSRQFGELQHSPNYFQKDGSGGRSRMAYPELFDASNLGARGNLLDVNDDRRQFRLGNELWHTDSSFLKVSAKYSLLNAHVVPPDSADTQFADTRAAYDALSGAEKAKIAPLVAEHSVFHSRGSIGLTNFTEADRKARPPAHHPVARLHPGSKRRALFVGSHASHIVGRPIAEGRVLLHHLVEAAGQPQFVYSHRWEAGDLVMWDNRCTLHRVLPFDDLVHVRDLRRTTVQGDA